MMEILILSVILIGIAILGLSITVLLKKDGKFPETEVGHNKDMRKLGLRCAKTDERILRHKIKGSCGTCIDLKC